MGGFTSLLRLNVPDFDQSPWDIDVNSNWLILDATVGMFSSVPNLVGVWRNSTPYTYGQSAIDSADSSIWSCVLTHTSSALPATFSTERTANPGRWASTGPGSQFWASQAANSASAAAASAAAAAASAALVGNALPITGGTMTGLLILSADPTNVKGAATKQYVDARVGGTGYLPLTGGTLTGALTVGGGGVNYTVQAANMHAMSLGWNGTNVIVTVDSTASFLMATTTYVSGSYLALTGGSLSGTIYTAGELQASSVLRLVSSNTYLYAQAGLVQLAWDAGLWRLEYNRTTGGLQYIRGGDNVVLFGIAGVGDISAPGNATFAGNGAIGGALTVAGGIYTGPGNRAEFYTDGGSITQLRMVDAAIMSYTWGTATYSWTSTASVGLMALDGGGNLSLHGAANATAFNVYSDERYKSVLGPSDYGLSELMDVIPIRFTREMDVDSVQHGFSAQQLKRVMPEAVGQIQYEGGGDMMQVAILPIMAALVNSVKELAARVNILEHR